MSENRLPLSKLQEYLLSFTQGRASAVSDNERASVQEGEVPWDVYDSGLYSYAIFFDSVIPGQENEISIRRKMMSYLTHVRETSLKQNKNGSFTAVELMGSGSRLFSEFPEGFFTKTAGITLNDLRSTDIKEKDKERSHTVIPLDVNTPDLESVLSTWRGKDDINLCIIRPVGGMTYLPKDEFLLFTKLAVVYRALAQRGVILTEIPELFVPYRDQWVEEVSRTNGLLIEWDTKNNVARIEKVTSDAPAALPSLPPRKILETGYRKRLEDSVFPDY